MTFSTIFSEIHVSDTTEGTTVDLSAWIGPMIVTLMALIVIMVCCCFFRIDPSAPHSEELDAFRYVIGLPVRCFQQNFVILCYNCID